MVVTLTTKTQKRWIKTHFEFTSICTGRANAINYIFVMIDGSIGLLRLAKCNADHNANPTAKPANRGFQANITKTPYFSIF
jgi:hypothetical protein